MKKVSDSRIGTIIRSIFNIRYWVDYDRLKSFTAYLGNGFKKMFVPQQSTTGESFKQAVRELHLDDAELLARQKGLYRLSILMVLIAIFMLGYTGYHVLYGTWRSILLSIVVMFIALALSFRYHFWYYQIKHRKLGVSIKEWYRQGLLGEKHE
ncbi:intracellular multiplication protein IcmV [Legionella quinlivanii]|uniref:Intracellular multiplication protein IcmV n=1 Tax=Legionella quinlivanii TaxID=45073 RepID=A0A0W0Y165_9GAMM|nr:type IVB secretion system protein IcmV [Legionella quinlivanii]KTD50386.1 intracellular multiplication protein IcmV [Legionella quinlivanii]MCW8449863.1 type IVB secretion system protein IcmV [Legionella quinlivanii]SEF41632.1 intracellular multiplication protein IcmV [Legionella quinlivanii DSM 21216]STY11986.1 intracellular multiplication protein IcmV [Legionella quinlivanii]